MSLACAAICRSSVCEWASPPAIWWSGRSARQDARSFTVIGDTVNLASRLEGANKAYKTDILVDEGTFQRAQNDVEGREIDFLAVLGRVEPVRVYQIIAPAGCLSAAEQQLCGFFAQGLAAYRARDWDQSERYFAQCLAVMPRISVPVALDGECAVRNETNRVGVESVKPSRRKPGWQGSTLAPSENPVNRR
jgi:hypothetical protein